MPKPRVADVIAASLAGVLAVLYALIFFAEPRWYNAVFAVLSFAFIPCLLWLGHAPVRLGACNLALLGVWATVCLILYPANTGIPPQLLVAPWVVFILGRTQSRFYLGLFVTVCMLGTFASPARWMLHDVNQLGPRDPVNFTLMMALHWLMIWAAALWGRSLQLKQLALQHEIDRQQERERTLIAAEIHDVLAHSLTLIKIQAGAGLIAPEKAQESLKQIQDVSSEGIQQVRSIIAALAAGGTTVSESMSITDLIEQFRAQGLEITARLDDLTTLSPLVQLALYRLSSECLTNCLKHQQPPVRVTLDIHITDSSVTFTLTSHGTTRATTTPGFGLIGLAERCRALGGSFTQTIDSTIVTSQAVLPVKGN